MSRKACSAPGGLLLSLAFLPLGALLPGPGGAAGQGVPPDPVAAARARVDSLLPTLERLAARRERAEEAVRQERLARSRIPLDTFMVGPLRVAAEPGQRRLATQVFQGAWEALQPMVAGSEGLLSPYLFVFRYSWDRERPVVQGDSVRWVQVHRRRPRAALEAEARKSLAQLLAGELPEEVALWSGGLPRSGSRQGAWAARDLLTAPSRAARECYQGDPDWCWEALGIGDFQGALERRYTPLERRYLVEGVGPGAPGSLGAALWRRCVGEGDLPACDAFLERRPLHVPLGAAARSSFVGHALRAGGPGAFERLRAGEGVPLRERLLAASALSSDSLAITWRRETLAARPAPWEGKLRSSLTLLGWLLLFALFATRSTRWRLG